jgi:hypothetical protein
MATWWEWLLYSVINLCVGYTIGVDFERNKRKRKK